MKALLVVCGLVCWCSLAAGFEEVITMLKDYPCYNSNETVQAKLIKEILYTHKELRALHGSPPLKWKGSLAKKARRHAYDMAHMNLFYHSNATDEGRGENIGKKTISSKEVTIGPTSMIVVWYNENQNYYYATQSKINPEKDIGHFTCMVWREVKFVGCALATAEDKDAIWSTSYLVCQYEPICNVKGQFGEMVPIPLNLKKTIIKDPSTVDINGCCDYTGVCGYYCGRFCNILYDVCCEACSNETICKLEREQVKDLKLIHPSEDSDETEGSGETEGGEGETEENGTGEMGESSETENTENQPAEVEPVEND